MQRILRSLLCLMALVAVTGLAACGGDEASESTDVNKLLTDTFSGNKKVDSGKFSLALKFDVKGGTSPVQGPVAISLAGPFESQGDGKLPKFDFEASLQGAGQSLRAGVAATDGKGFVSFNGTDYVLSADAYRQFVTSYENAAKEGKKDDQSLQSLGMDPRKWLTGAKNAGEAKVGDTETIEITGSVDVAKLLDDLNGALQRAGSLGLQGQARLPTKLTEKQRQELQKAIRDPKVSIFTGKEDTILRRMNIAFAVQQEGQGNATVDFDLKLEDLNEGQEFKAPESPKPFEELMQALGGLGALGGGLGGGGSPGGSGSGGSGSGSAPSSENAAKYTKCVQDAGNDLQKAQKCAELLVP